MESQELRKKFLDFFAARGHAVVLSSSLIPDDKSVLLTTAGMQQFKPYLTGKANPVKDFGGKNVFSIQKCFRTDDIDEVGDLSHLTFFEMVGNFSFGGYFKETAIPLSFEFLTSPEGMGIQPHKIFVTAFEGDTQVPRDDEAIALWQEQFKKVGMDAKIGERIFLYGRKKNWWEAGPGPAGPDAEMFYDFGTPHDSKFGPACHPNCDCGRFVEIGNDVFVQYNKTEQGAYEPLAQKSVDNGRGFERLVMVAQGKKNVFETDLFTPIITMLPLLMPEQSKRIIADHIRGIIFLIADGARPGNKDREYILRRLMRRAIAHLEDKDYFEPPEGHAHKVKHNLVDIAKQMIVLYGAQRPYEYLIQQHDTILEIVRREEERFSRIFFTGQDRLIKKIYQLQEQNVYTIPAKDIFYAVTTDGFALEWIRDVAKEYSINLDIAGFEEMMEKHREISRAGATAKFGGHGLYMKTGEVTIRDESEVEKVTRLHTATHLLHAALRAVLGSEVRQDGSDITVERTRFDFTFPRKVTSEELAKVEAWVNEAVRRDLEVVWEEMAYEEGIKKGALGFFREKYPPRVKIYTMTDSTTGEILSCEFCGGPHVTHTTEVGTFKIIKEEASSAGIRRIRGIVE